MIFQMILHVLLTPTNFCFHDKVITSLPGVLGIKWSPLNIGIAFTEMSSKMQDCLFPNLGIVRNMKPTYVFLYSVPKKAYALRHVGGKTRPCLVMSPYLIKAMRNFFMFLTILSIRNMSQHKGPFTHLFVTNLPFIFMWVQFVKNHLKIWRKKFDLSQLIILEIMRILLAFSYFPTYSEIWSPDLPLQTFSIKTPALTFLGEKYWKSRFPVLLQELGNTGKYCPADWAILER